ncbi:hypothetical protein VTK73DRAFT_9383 [Phialemonium thermophilum]|uniref:Secreted protein n=1 Tax=Phialemonium thermophilum TaxID=223376 RepID=A0ABR3W2S6_9PEZI
MAVCCCWYCCGLCGRAPAAARRARTAAATSTPAARTVLAYRVSMDLLLPFPNSFLLIYLFPSPVVLLAQPFQSSFLRPVSDKVPLATP